MLYLFESDSINAVIFNMVRDPKFLQFGPSSISPIKDTGFVLFMAASCKGRCDIC